MVGWGGGLGMEWVGMDLGTAISQLGDLEPWEGLEVERLMVSGGVFGRGWLMAIVEEVWGGASWVRVGKVNLHGRLRVLRVA